MDQQPLVSVVTPSYNQAPFLEETILSVLDQGYPNIEYIIIDGGSTDGSVEIIKRYEARLAYWVSEPDRGQSHAINKGWQRATGDIVAYLNSDDLYVPGAISAAVHALTSDPTVSMVYSDALVIDEHGAAIETLPGRPFDMRRQLLTEGVVPQPSAFIRKDALDKVGLLDENLHLVMDYDLWSRLGLEYEIRYISGACWAKFREHVTAKSTASMDLFPLERRQALDKVFARANLLPAIQGLQQDAYASISLQQARLALCAGQPDRIGQPLLCAMTESPGFVARAPISYYLLLRSFLPWWKGSPSRAVGKVLQRASRFRARVRAFVK